jgi:HD-like signal output (HDOD) protein
MRAANRFEDLLPNSSDPAKSKMRARLVTLLNSHGELIPAAASPLGKLWRLVNASNSSLGEIEEVIQLEPALAGRVFRVANSAAYNARATEISEALRFLGFKRLREMAFSAGVLNQFSTLKVPQEWELFWLRNIFVARLSDRIASVYYQTDGAEYLAGLIHDVGWLFLATHFSDEFSAIITSEKTLLEAEKDVLPFGHANIAAAMAARSSLPLKAIDAIAYHHKQMLMTQSTLIAPNQNPLFLGIILSVCDRIADGCELDIFGRAESSMADLWDSPEIVWLKNYGRPIPLEDMAGEELVKAQEMYNVFFTQE